MSQLSARRASGTAFRPRLRSRKNLGGCCPGDDTDGILNLVAGQPELPGDRIYRLPGPEQVDHVIDAGPAAGEPRPPERVIRIDGHFGDLILRQTDELGVPVASEIDPLQVLLHDLAEHPLVVAHHDKFARGLTFRRVTRVLRVVVQDLRAVRVAACSPARALALAPGLERQRQAGPAAWERPRSGMRRACRPPRAR